MVVRFINVLWTFRKLTIKEHREFISARDQDVLPHTRPHTWLEVADDFYYGYHQRCYTELLVSLVANNEFYCFMRFA